MAQNVDFTPCCLACRYDLSGSPDGRCPECGAPFTLEMLRAQRLAEQRRTRRSPEFVVALVFGFSLVAWWLALALHAWGAAPVFGAIATALAACWAWLARRQFFEEHPGHVAWALVITIPMCMAVERWLLWFGVLGAAPWVVGAMLAWAQHPRRNHAVPWMLIGTTLLAPGLVGVVSGGSHWWANEYWSAVDDAWLWARPGNYPLSNATECLLGAVLVATSAHCFFLARRVATPRADRSSPSGPITRSPSPPPSSSPCPPG